MTQGLMLPRTALEIMMSAHCQEKKKKADQEKGPKIQMYMRIYYKPQPFWTCWGVPKREGYPELEWAHSPSCLLYGFIIIKPRPLLISFWYCESCSLRPSPSTSLIKGFSMFLDHFLVQGSFPKLWHLWPSLCTLSSQFFATVKTGLCQEGS